MCITETRLTAEVTNEALFLPSYFIYRKHWKITDFKSKHGGVLIAVKSSFKHENVDIPFIHDDFIVFKINLSMSSLIICCIHNAPEQNHYRWAVNDFLNLLEKLNKSIVDTNSLVLLTGDINFTETSWANMSSTKDYVELILDQFIENNPSNVLPFSSLHTNKPLT